MALFDCTSINLQEKSKDTANVKKLQTALNKLGYYNKSIDGDFGYYTKQAVKKFQSTYKLQSDGVFGPITCKKFNEVMDTKEKVAEKSTTSTPTTSLKCDNINLKKNSKGDEVKTLQTMLSSLGYYTRQVDGDFGDYTEAAVKQFQKDTGHTDDGVFGPKTCPDLNKKYSEKQKNSTKNTTVITDNRPEYEKQDHYKLTILPDVVVLPDVTVQDNTVTSQGGSIDTNTNFDCSKINLKRNSNGDDVKKLQTILKARGYYTRSIDGDFGKYTETAVKKLQAAQGNKEDGIFGTETCKKLQSTSATSNDATGTANKKNVPYVITNIMGTPSFTTDLEGFTQEITVTLKHSLDTIAHIRKLQKTEFIIYKGYDEIKKHTGYISEIKISNADDADKIELNLVGYTVFLEQTIDIPEDVTGKKSELLKQFVEKNGLKLNLNLDGLEDSEYTIKAKKAETATSGSSSGGGGLTEVHGNDCTATNPISARSYDIDTCGGNTKIGDSSANYAQDTKHMTAKEAILDVYNRFHYGPSLTSSAVYMNNRRCPKQMWTKTGKFWGNCADISRLVKAVGEVHGLKVGIRHCPSHYYNLIEVDGTVYKFDCCFSSGYTGKNYGNELCNNLTKNGGPWSK